MLFTPDLYMCETNLSLKFPETSAPYLCKSDQYARCALFAAHQRDRPQLLAHLKSAESIVLLYDVERLETLHHLDSFWLPLIEANTDVRQI